MVNRDSHPHGVWCARCTRLLETTTAMRLTIAVAIALAVAFLLYALHPAAGPIPYWESLVVRALKLLP
jgi:hypothetical protein